MARVKARTNKKAKRARRRASADETGVQFIERPNGVYWRASDGGKEYGPYATLGEAEADALSAEVTDFEPAESVEEAEAEIGIAEWIDPDTGAPAEESVPRLEDH